MSHQPTISCSARDGDGPRVLLYERQALVRQGLRCLLERMGFRVMEVAADSEFVPACQARPDVIVADQSRVADLAKLLKPCPATKVVVLTDDGAGREAERLGYEIVSKNADATTLGNAIRGVCSGPGWGLPEESLESPLTARQLTVLRLLATGRSNKEIGSALGVTEKTVRQHLTVIFESIRVRNRTEAALYALGYRSFRTQSQPERLAA